MKKRKKTKQNKNTKTKKQTNNNKKKKQTVNCMYFKYYTLNSKVRKM